jgi:hypothetical protein
MRSLIVARIFVGICSLTAASALGLAFVRGQEGGADRQGVVRGSGLRESFEDADTRWLEEGGDVKHQVRAHDRTDQTAHSGRYSERISFTAGNGTQLHYSLPISRALVSDDLRVSVWVKSDRPGVQLLARVVFPLERDPGSLMLLGTLLSGTTSDQPGGWQRLELRQPDLAMERQARLLRVALKRDVDTREAYIDRILLNLYTGQGSTEVFIDDLEVTPILDEPVHLSSATLRQPAEETGPPVEVSQDRLLIAGRPRLLRAVRAPGLAPTTLKEFGFSVVSVEWPLDIARIEQAVTAGLWLMPQLPSHFSDDGGLGLPLSQPAGEMPFRDAVLCWNLGTDIGPEVGQQVEEAVRDMRKTSPRRPLAADVTGDFRGYSRSLDVIGAHRWPIGTAMEVRSYREWLIQRRYLARPGSYFFTWIQAAADPAGGTATTTQAGPEPDQLRLLTYSALAAGYRGVGFWADETLGQAETGRSRLLELGLLNLELQLLEPYFASAGSATTVSVDASPVVVKRGPGTDPHEVPGSFGRNRGFSGGFARMPKLSASANSDRDEVQATLIRSDRGLVVIPIWYGAGAQYVPGQLATNDLSVVVPGVPDAAQAWHVTPASIQMVKRERVAGGTRLTLPEFDLTAMVLLSSETSVLEPLRKEVTKTRSWAAQWAAELAALQFDQVRRVNAQLTSLGRTQPDAVPLLRTADERLSMCRAALSRSEFAAAYTEAQRTMRALRIIERAHWEDAVRGLSAPQTSPYATSFATLPDHWRLMREVGSREFGPNLVPGGEFESTEMLAGDGWTQRQDGGDALELKASLSASVPHRGERSLHLEIKPQANQSPPRALDPTLAALVSKPVPVQAGDIVRIRFWLRVPATIHGSGDGAVIFDSLGGPALAISRSEPLEWNQYTLYRRAGVADQLTITLGLTGIGDVYIDDLEVRRLAPGTPLTRENAAPTARR